jgi:CheY-like chemotaxis protein
MQLADSFDFATHPITMLGSLFKPRKPSAEDDAFSAEQYDASRGVEAYDLPTIPQERDDDEMNGFSHTVPQGSLLDVQGMTTQPASLDMVFTPPPGPERKRVLIVDDDLTSRLYLRAKLELRGGVDVYEATTGPEALSLAMHSSFDCVMLDVDMDGGKTGFEVCREIRSLSAQHNGTRPRIFMITSRSGVIDRMRATLAGADTFMSKPPHPGVLAELLQSL